MENANLLIAFIAVTAAAVVVQACMLIGMYLAMRKSSRLSPICARVSAAARNGAMSRTKLRASDGRRRADALSILATLADRASTRAR